jgi:hypothetical protein
MGLHSWLACFDINVVVFFWAGSESSNMSHTTLLAALQPANTKAQSPIYYGHVRNSSTDHYTVYLMYSYPN